MAKYVSVTCFLKNSTLKIYYKFFTWPDKSEISICSYICDLFIYSTIPTNKESLVDQMELNVNLCDKCGTVEGCYLRISTCDEFLMNMTVIRSRIFNHFSKSRTLFVYISSFSSQLLLVNSMVLSLLALASVPRNQMSTAGSEEWLVSSYPYLWRRLCVVLLLSCDTTNS